MQAGGLNVCIFRPSRQRLSADSRGDFCQKLLHLSMQVCRACMQVCSACMQASRQAPLQHLSSTSGPKSQILGVIPVRICLFWAPRSSEACMQAGRQAPLQNQAGTFPAPLQPRVTSMPPIWRQSDANLAPIWRQSGACGRPILRKTREVSKI